jgi:hypothetical protein
LEPVGILPRVAKKLRNFATLTDGYTDGLVPIDIIPRVAKQLWNFATLTDGYTDGLVLVGILPRVAKKLQNFSTLTDDYIDGLLPVGFLPRVAKTLQPLPQSPMDISMHSPTDDAYSKAHECQTAWSVGIVTDRFFDGCVKSNAPVL